MLNAINNFVRKTNPIVLGIGVVATLFVLNMVSEFLLTIATIPLVIAGVWAYYNLDHPTLKTIGRTTFDAIEEGKKQLNSFNQGRSYRGTLMSDLGDFLTPEGEHVEVLSSLAERPETFKMGFLFKQKMDELWEAFRSYTHSQTEESDDNRSDRSASPRYETR